jgi:hypothetical protein
MMAGQAPNFEQHVVQRIDDGYRAGTFDVDGVGRPHLAASGSVTLGW